MKLLVLSDLHLEFGERYFDPPSAEFDAVILAGDISNPGTNAVAWARSTFAGRPVILVPGNHEFYNCLLDDELAGMKAAAASNVHVLDRAAVVIDGVRFLGCRCGPTFSSPW